MTRQGFIGGASACATILAALCASASAHEPAPEPGLADREAIEATLSRYTRGLDRLDADLYVSAMAPDIAIIVDTDAFHGHDAMRQIIADEAALRRNAAESGETPRTLFHLETNSSITFTAPDRAVHRAYWLTVSRTGDGADGIGLFDVGSSIDELRKIDGVWLITRREILLHP